MILPKPVGINQELNIHLNSYEVLTAELVPANKIAKNLPLGIKFSTGSEGLLVYGEAAKNENIKFADSKTIEKVNFSGSADKIKYSESLPVANDGKNFESKIVIDVPAGYKNPKFAFLLEPDSKLQNDLKPQMEINLNGVSQKLQVEEENGKWFWVLSDLNTGKNSVSYKIIFKDKVHGKISSWIFADQQLFSSKITGSSAISEELLPSKPYPENIQKLMISIKKNKF